MEVNNLPVRATIRFFWRHVSQQKWWMIGVLLAVPAASLTLYYLPPIIVANILQHVTSGNYVPGDVWGSFGKQILIYIALLAVGGIALWRVAVFLIWSLHQRVTQSIHQEVFAHLLSMSANFHANRFGGSLVSQTNKLASAYVTTANTTFFDLLTLFLSFIFSAIILWPRVPGIALALLAFSLSFMFIATRVTRPVRRLQAIRAELESKQTGLLADAISNVMAIKGYAAEKHENQRYAKATSASRNAEYNVLVAATRRDTIFSTSTITIGCIGLILTVIAVVTYRVNIGTAFLVLTYTSIITQRLWDFAQTMLREYNRAFGDARDMIDILAIPPEVKDPERPEAPRITKGAIDFADVSFTHPDSRENETLFEHFDLQIAPGEKIGLVGHSGAGKTTLTKLLLRFHDIDGGAITIDGQNIANITQDDLRRHIAYVPQEPLLFHRTIAENIAYGKPGASDEEIKAAAKKAYALEFVEKLPKGFDTLVGERGVKLSGGQRQRIAIARAILKDAPILLLDEATSALDSESEGVIQAALWELMKGCTTIVIAHRLSTIQRMDRIVVLDEGNIIEEGGHSALLKHSGVYAKLWARQSGGFIST